MVNIVLITENLGSGGAERQLSGLAVMLKEKGYDVTVITYIENQFHESYLKENGVDYIFAAEMKRKSTRVFKLVSRLRRIKPDVVISFLPHVNVCVCLSRLLCKFKLIVSERSHTQSFSRKVKIQFNLYRIADYVVPNSRSEADNIASHIPALRNKMRVIPNYVNTDVFKPNSNREVSEGAPIRLISVGRFIESKNVLAFLDAFSDVLQQGYNVTLKWIGSMYDKDYCAKIREKIEKLNLSEKVTLQDQTNDVATEYQNSDIFCFPTIYEGYPNVLVEAMGCGLPVVCSNVCENPRIAKDGINGFLFNPFEQKDMTTALIRMLSLSKAEREKMSLCNRQQVLAKNSTETFVKSYVELF